MKKCMVFLLLLLAGWSTATMAASTTPNCRFPYSNSDPLNQALDKLDKLLGSTFVNCNTATPAFAGVTTTSTTSTSTSSSTSSTA